MAKFFRPKRTYRSEELVTFLCGSKADRETAIRELYRKHAEPVRLYITSKGGSVDAAREVLQKVILRIIERARDGQLMIKGDIHGYVYQACKNAWLNNRRYANRHDDIAIESFDNYLESPTDPYELLEQKDFKKALTEILGQLGEKCKYLLYWSLGQGLDMKSVARELNYENAQTAMNIKARCKKKIKDLVSQHEVYQQLVKQIMFKD